MPAAWGAIGLCLAYAATLVGVARWGDRAHPALDASRVRRTLYALSTCVFCGTWTVCGSLGIAAHRGLNFLPFFAGPVVAFAFGRPTILRMVRASRVHNLTSVSDFVAARYGKSAHVAAIVTGVLGGAALLSLTVQMGVLARALAVFVEGSPPPTDATGVFRPALGAVWIVLTGLTLVLGARHLDLAAHRRGLMLAAAVESLVRLVAMAAVTVFVVAGLSGGLGRLTELVTRTPAIDSVVNTPLDAGMWSVVVLATIAVLPFRPAEFDVAILGNRNEGDIRTAAWLVPFYAVALSLVVMPLAVAGLALLPQTATPRELVLVALPVRAGHPIFSALALVVQLSLATTSTILTAATVGAMITNDLSLPLVLRRTAGRRGALPILTLRRAAIVALMAAAALLAAVTGHVAVYALGTLALATIGQIAPAALGGLIWSRGTGRGAIGGTLAGLAVVTYTLLLPLSAPHSAIVTDGPLGFDALRPTALFGLAIDPFAQALVWSLTINVIAYCGLSLSRPATANERLQAGVFLGTQASPSAAPFRLRHASLAVADLTAGIGRYMDTAAVRRRFAEWHKARDLVYDEARQADPALLQFAEELAATSLGAASARTAISLLLQERAMSAAAARQMIDDAAFEIQNSRDMLQHAIDVARDGMAVYDAELRLIAWNRAYRDMFQLPADLLRVGTPLDILVRSNAERGVYGPGDIDLIIGPRVEALLQPTEGSRLYSAPFGRVLEMRSIRLSNGGLFFTYTDATAQVTSEEELEAENMTLERRVRERTEELERLNVELVRAKAEAEDANVSKSRFLAAASHDLLQPLSAARLYTTSLRERLRILSLGDATSMLASNIDASLEAVEDILGALLEISHLDAGATRTDVTSFGVGELLRHLQLEFEPMARERGLDLRVVPSSLRVVSDRKLLRRMLQNLVSNAVKYTAQGRVLVGARRRGDEVRFSVYDTGIGIPEAKRRIIFREFERLPAGVEVSPGAGLGLSIVERLSAVLDHPVALQSVVGKGSVFSVATPRAEADAPGVAVAAGPQAVRQRSLDGMTVAAIDNESHILSAIKLLLQGWDCVVASGVGLYEVERALDELDVVPDVIVADYHIGESDGLDVIAALRTRYGMLPAVLVTADRSPVVRDLAQAADVRVLHKPLKPAALRALLSQWHLVKATVD